MSGIQFTKATKAKAKARIALAGPTGSGKTYTALRVASVLSPGSIAVLDTERGSASKYSDVFDFDSFEPDSYAPELLIEALTAAGAAGYGCFIADSLSHFWMGADGMLEQVDRAGKRSSGGNSFAGWKEMRPVERRMIDALVAYPGHVIVTMRTKTEWVIELNDRGKNVPRKIGTKPEQREGIEYEFDVVGDLSTENELVITKTRCPALKRAVIAEPGEDFAETIRAWLDAGVAPVDAAAFVDRAVATDATYGGLRSLYDEVESRRMLDVGVLDPATGQPTTLGELIKAYGRQAKDRDDASRAEAGTEAGA